MIEVSKDDFAVDPNNFDSPKKTKKYPSCHFNNPLFVIKMEQLYKLPSALLLSHRTKIML